MIRQLGNSSWVYVEVDVPAQVAGAVEALENAGNVVIDVVPLYGLRGSRTGAPLMSVLTGALIRCASDVKLLPESIDKGATNRG